MHLDTCIDRLMEERAVEHIAVRVGKNDGILMESYRGACPSTRFDMASVTKILATTTLSLLAFDKGLLAVEDKVSAFFACDREKEGLTVGHLLTHTMGIGHKPLNRAGNTYENIGDYILSIPCDIPVGTNVLYSCPAFILLGKILERVFGDSLDRLFDTLVCKPLGLKSTGFRPPSTAELVNSNPQTEKIGIVNDYNCQFLGGVAGNAGVFSNMEDMTVFAGFLLNRGFPLLSRATFDAAVQNRTDGMCAARGLGYLYVDEAYAQTGRLFPVGSIGHCGHTGQSVFVDLKSGLYAIILSDATRATTEKYGKEEYGQVKQMRAALHNAIWRDLGKNG